MYSGFLKTLVGLLILSVILVAAGFVFFKTLFPLWYFNFFPWLVLILFLIHLGFLAAFYRTVHKPHTQFVRGFLLSKTAKLMLYLALVLVYVLASPGTAVPFAVTLSVLYIAYTAYDLYVTTIMVKHKKDSAIPN